MTEAREERKRKPRQPDLTAPPKAVETRLYQVVARQITGLIELNRSNREWRMPSERELADELNVSRPVVREALIALEMLGIVEVRSRSGIIIRQSSAGQFSLEALEADIGPGPFELLEARLAVEASAAAIAAEKVTQSDIDYLVDCVRRMELERDVQLLHEEGDRDFHLAIARFTGNKIIVSMVNALWESRDKSPMWRKLHEHIHAEALRPLWIGDHYAVIAALRLRNPDASYRAMSRHIRNVIAELLEADDAGDIALPGGSNKQL